MIDAMLLRGFSPRTQEAYCAAVGALARHYRRGPDTLSTEQLQSYLLHLISDKKLAYASVNQASCAFRFLFGAVLRRPEIRLDVLMAKVPKRLPQILTREEVWRLIEASATLRARTLLTTTYAAGLRVSEVCALQLADIESAPERMCLKVRQGKGGGRQDGKLRSAEPLLPEAAWAALLTRLYIHDWVVYAKQSLGGPEQVLEYLGRHTHRVAISNERILGMQGDTVRLRVRDPAHPNRKRTLRMPAQTFIERFLLHVLPKGFKRIRHYGLLGPAGKAAKLALARAALAAPAPAPVVIESLRAFLQRVDRLQCMCCPHCGTGQFVPTAPLAPTPSHVPSLRGPP
jgi:integrase